MFIPLPSSWTAQHIRDKKIVWPLRVWGSQREAGSLGSGLAVGRLPEGAVRACRVPGYPAGRRWRLSSEVGDEIFGHRQGLNFVNSKQIKGPLESPLFIGFTWRKTGRDWVDQDPNQKTGGGTLRGLLSKNATLVPPANAHAHGLCLFAKQKAVPSGWFFLILRKERC